MDVGVRGFDHFVLTVRDLRKTIDFYCRGLGMTEERFGEGRVALLFGPHKINLHQAGAEITPHASSPTPGSADFCLLTDTPLTELAAHLESLGIRVLEGPVARTGARGPIMSIYVRDPDQNLVELAGYLQ